MNKTAALAVTAIAATFVAYHYYSRYTELAHLFRIYSEVSDIEHDLLVKMINELKNDENEDE